MYVYILLVLNDLKKKKQFRKRIVFLFQILGSCYGPGLGTGLSPRRSGFTSRPLHAGYLVDKVALGNVLLRTNWIYIYIYIYIYILIY